MMFYFLHFAFNACFFKLYKIEYCHQISSEVKLFPKICARAFAWNVVVCGVPDTATVDAYGVTNEHSSCCTTCMLCSIVALRTSLDGTTLHVGNEVFCKAFHLEPKKFHVFGLAPQNDARQRTEHIMQRTRRVRGAVHARLMVVVCTCVYKK